MSRLEEFPIDIEGLYDHQEHSVPLGSQGYIRFYYLDQDGHHQEAVILSTRPMQFIMEGQERVRAGLERLVRSLGFEMLSVQLELVGTQSVKMPWSQDARVIAFPGTAECLD